MTSPTQRALAYCRDQGWIAQVVEKWEPHSHRRIDLFGVIDLVVLRDGKIVGVQVTSGGNISSRIHKALEEPRLEAWFRSGGGYEVWGWRKLKVVKKDGKKGKAERWQLRTEEITLDTLLEHHREVGGSRPP